MTVKPLNLSILIGNMNKSPQISPRSLQNNKKSRIPLATSQTLQGGVTTFRQWADPPPPPPRSRNSERKFSNTHKKRPGSADPRFRRSLEGTGAHVHHQNDPIIIAEIKPQSSSVSDLLTIDPKEKLNEYIHPFIFNKKEDKIEVLKNANPLNLEGSSIEASEIQNLHAHFDVDDTQIRSKHVMNPQYDYDHIDKYNDVYDNRDDTIFNETQSILTSRTESKYSQTDMYTNDYNTDIHEILSPVPLPTIDTDNDVVQYISGNYEQQSRYLDGLVLNRTRSISTVYELEPVTKVKHTNKKSFGSNPRVLIMHNYWTYLEIWAAFSFLTIILLFGWYYLLPFLSDALSTWIYPAPPVTASDYIRRSVTELVTSTVETIYGLLTTPANRRLY